MVKASFKRELAAILSANVKNYSRFMGEDDVVTVKMLTSLTRDHG